jgi:hypothetical protein
MAEFDLVRWETPFADAVRPSVTLLANPSGLVRVLVRPSGFGRYPVYLVTFSGEVAGYLHEQESWAHPLPSNVRWGPDCHCACRWLGSPWIHQYDSERDYFEKYVEPVVGGTLKHYLIFGGDSFVQVLFAGEPSFTVVPGPTVFELTYKA